MGNENIETIAPIDSNIPYIRVNGINIPFSNITGPRDTNIRPIKISEARIWMNEPPQAIPTTVPVTVILGNPVVNMPGCVKAHKENTRGNKNTALVDNDPKGNVVLCDGGMPYYQPPDYQANELTWMTVYGEPEEEPTGVNAGDTGDVGTPDTPDPPPAKGDEGDPECPGPLEPRIGSVGPNEKEKVVGHELQPDPNNANKLICVSLYEDIGIVEQYLPSPQIVTTTAVIASVAASSALLAKPLADLLLRVVKPAVKQVLTKVNAVLGKTPYRPTQAELKTNEYRKKKGLLGINFAKNHQKREKAEKKRKKMEEESRKKTQS